MILEDDEPRVNCPSHEPTVVTAPCAPRPGLNGARSCRIQASSTGNAGSSNTRHRSTLRSQHGLCNARFESLGTKIKPIPRAAFGFKSPEVLIALAMLNLGGHRPVLPDGK